MAPSQGCPLAAAPQLNRPMEMSSNDLTAICLLKIYPSLLSISDPAGAKIHSLMPPENSTLVEPRGVVGSSGWKDVERGILFPRPYELQISDFELTNQSVHSAVHEVHN